jgi:hypothetical protein
LVSQITRAGTQIFPDANSCQRERQVYGNENPTGLSKESMHMKMRLASALVKASSSSTPEEQNTLGDVTPRGCSPYISPP